MSDRIFGVLGAKSLKNSEYNSKSPASAASKIFNDLCGGNKKTCHKVIRLIDKRSDKVYKYRVERKLVNKTVMIAGKPVLFKYTTNVKAM